MGNVAEDQRFPRNPNYNDPGVLGGTWTNTVTGEVWECAGHYDINALKVTDTGCIWYLKDAASSGSGGGAKEPYIEETYDADGKLTAAIMHGYTKVPSSKFANNENLQTFVDYGTTIKNIENSAFYKCTNLALTSLPSGVTSIGGSAFGLCTNLALTSLPSGVTSIGDSAFSGCTNLALTSLPNGITSLGQRAFKNCTALALTSLPSGLTSIPMETFYGCTNITEIKVPWAEGAVANAPWGATNATITYNYTGE